MDNKILEELQKVQPEDIIRLKDKMLNNSVFLELEVIEFARLGNIGTTNWQIEAKVLRGSDIGNIRKLDKLYWEQKADDDSTEIEIVKNTNVSSNIVPSVADQLGFMRREFDNYFYQVSETPHAQVIALKRTNSPRALAIVMIDASAKDKKWIKPSQDVLQFFVNEININLKALDSNAIIEAFYLDVFKPNTRLNNRLFGQFYLTFKENVSDRDFDKIWISVERAILGYIYTYLPSKVYGLDFEMEGIIEIVELSESFGDVGEQVWNVQPYDIDTYYEQKRKYIGVVEDVIRYTMKSNPSKSYSGKITKIYPHNGGLEIGGNTTFKLEKLVETYFVEIIKFFDLKIFVDIVNQMQDRTQAPTQAPTQAQPITIDFDAKINDTKKEIGQLVFLRSLQTPLDFEENIKLNQLLVEKQKNLDKLIFQKTEVALSQENIFDDLFEQSFTPIQSTYENIFVKDEGSSEFFTPNGERSSLNDAENLMIRTPLFLEWFGDWQLTFQYKEAGITDFDCSKVLSSKFEPQVVWHGTGAEFSYFRFDNFPAAYFALNQSYSQWFADLHSRDGEGFTIPFFLNVRNPLDLTLFETKKIAPKTFFDYMFLQTGLTKDELDLNPMFLDSSLQPMETWIYLRNNPKMLKKLADTKVFDGIHFYETNPGVDESEPFYKTEAWIIFDPHQAKLAGPSRGVLLFSSLKSFLLKKGGQI